MHKVGSTYAIAADHVRRGFDVSSRQNDIRVGPTLANKLYAVDATPTNLSALES